MMSSEVYNKRKMGGVSTYSLGEESITFSTMIADNWKKVELILTKYKK